MGVYIDWSAIQCCGECLVLCPQSVGGCCGFWIGKQSKDEIITSPEFLGTVLRKSSERAAESHKPRCFVSVGCLTGAASANISPLAPRRRQLNEEKVKKEIH
jgi:hypothetical protein